MEFHSFTFRIKLIVEMLFYKINDRFPKLRLLDFRRIRQKDRQAAMELFKSKKGKELLREIAKKAKANAANPAAAEANSSKGISDINTLTIHLFHVHTNLCHSIQI